MFRRSLPILLVLLAAVALGVVCLVGGIGGSGEAGNVAPTTSDRSDEARASAGASLTDPPRAESQTTLPVEPTSTHEERVGATPHDFDPELAQAIWVAGRVVLPPGTPADERVVIVAEGTPFESRDYHRAAMEPDGSFRVAFARGTSMGVLRIEARFLYMKTFHTVVLPTGGREILLRPLLGGCIRGRVLLPLAGAPPRASVVGRTVRAFRRESQESFSDEEQALASTAVDDELQFELSAVPVGTCFVDLQSAEASCVEPMQVQVGPGRLTAIDLPVEANARITGVVVDPDGVPVPRAVVFVSKASRSPEHGSGFETDAEARSDSEGRFELQGLGAGAYHLWAEASGAVGSPSMELELLPGEVVADLTIRLSRGGRIVGQVVDSEGRPKGSVTVSARSKTPRQSGTGATDELGRFEIEDLVPGEYRVGPGIRFVSDADPEWTTTSSLRSALVRVEEGRTTEIVFGGRSADSVDVEGTVRVGGKPAGKAWVIAESLGGLGDEHASATCDENGNYLLTLDHSGWFTFHVQAPQRGSTLFETVEVPATKSLRLDFDFEGEGRLTGRVVDGKGAAVESVHVTAVPDGDSMKLGGRHFTAGDMTDERGAFTLEGLAPGTYRLEARNGSMSGEVEPDAGRATLEGVRLGEAETIDGLVLTMQACCSVEVSLRRADGKAVPETSVVPQGQGTFHSRTSFSGRSRSTPTEYVLEGLAPGQVTISATAQDPPLSGMSTVAVAPGERGKVEVVLHPATTLRVRLHVGGLDAREVSVLVRDASGTLVGASGPHESEASERRFGPFTPGRYTILAEHPSGASTQGTIEITGGAEVVASMRL